MEGVKKSKRMSEKVCAVCKNNNHQRYVPLKSNELQDCVECFNLPEPRTGSLCAPCHLRLHRWILNRDIHPQKSWNHVVDYFVAHPKDKEIEFLKQPELVAESAQIPETRRRKRLAAKSMDPDKPAEPSKQDPKSTAPNTNETSEPYMLPLRGWQLRSICCGQILVGPNKEVLIDPRLLRAHDGVCICSKIYNNNTDQCAVETEDEAEKAPKTTTNIEYLSQTENDAYTTETSAASSFGLHPPNEFSETITPKLNEYNEFLEPSNSSANLPNNIEFNGNIEATLKTSPTKFYSTLNDNQPNLECKESLNYF